MSLLIPRSSITDDEAQKLLKDLTVNSNLSFNFRSRASNVKNLLVYKISIIDGVEYLHVPFMYGCLYKQMNNDQLMHPAKPMQFLSQLRDVQKVCANQAINDLNNRRTCILGFKTGQGKTRLGCYLTTRIGHLTCVALRSSPLVGQWMKTYQEHTTCICWEVDKTQEPPPNFNVIICLWTRTSIIPWEIRRQIGTLIIDEAHEFNNETSIKAILDFVPRVMIFCTATFQLLDGTHRAMQLFAGEKIIDCVTDVAFGVLRLRVPFEPDVVTRENYGTDFDILKKSLYYNEQRNEFIFSLVQQIQSLRQKIMIFTTETKHTKLLYQLFLDRGYPVDYLAEKKSTCYDTYVTVVNLQKGGTGFDYATSCINYQGVPVDTIIFACSIKNLVKLIQAVGRALRSETPLIIQISDRNGILDGHFRDNNKWYTSEGAICNQQDLRNSSTIDLNSISVQLALIQQSREKKRREIADILKNHAQGVIITKYLPTQTEKSHNGRLSQQRQRITALKERK